MPVLRKTNKYPSTNINHQTYKNEVLKIVKDLEINNLCDCGCGIGLWLEDFKTWGISPIGVDYNHIVDNNCRVTADCHKLPFKNSSFDCTFSFHTVHILDSPKIAIREMLRITRPNGFVFIGFSDQESNINKLYWGNHPIQLIIRKVLRKPFKPFKTINPKLLIEWTKDVSSLFKHVTLNKVDMYTIYHAIVGHPVEKFLGLHINPTFLQKIVFSCKAIQHLMVFRKT